MTTTIERGAEHRYAPAGSALEVFGYRGPEVLLSGPAGTGKSRACLEKMHFMALHNPGMRGLICRKTAVSLGSTALVTFREHVAAEALASGELLEHHDGSVLHALKGVGVTATRLLPRQGLGPGPAPGSAGKQRGRGYARPPSTLSPLGTFCLQA